jgi:hypothetical protein
VCDVFYFLHYQNAITNLIFSITLPSLFFVLSSPNLSYLQSCLQCVIEFSFLCGNNNNNNTSATAAPSEEVLEVSFDYIFGSDEYPEYVNSPFNDVFAFYLNGKNIALLPNNNGSSSNNTAVSINTVNAQVNSQYFHENTYSVEDGKSAYPTIEADGFTTILTARGTPKQGVDEWNHIKLVVTDVGDNIYDSYVLIAAHSFTCMKRNENNNNNSPTTSIPTSSPSISPTQSPSASPSIIPTEYPSSVSSSASPSARPTNQIVNNNVENRKPTSLPTVKEASIVPTINKCLNNNNNMTCPNKRIDPILGYHDCGWGIFHDCTCQVSR